MIGISGCAALPPLIGVKEWTVNQVISVDSTPQGADVYMNDKLIGKTPCKVPVIFNIDTASYWPKEQYIIRVSKEGYKDAAEAVEFKQAAHIFDKEYQYFGAEVSPGTKVRTFYNLTLEKKE